MASQSQSSNVWLPSLVLLGLAATSYMVHENAFRTSRPGETIAQSQATANPDDVEARLWQDPLSAIDRHLKAEEGAKGHRASGKPHHADALKREIGDHLDERRPRQPAHGESFAGEPRHDKPNATAQVVSPDFTVLAVMVPSAPYTEPAERRRRIRYAILSGLNRSGLVSEDQEHIHFFVHPAAEHRPDHSKQDEDTNRVYVAYEFLERVSRPASTNGGDGRGAAVLLWIPTEASQNCALSGLDSIFAAIAPDGKHAQRMRYRVIGPPESGTLVEMVREVLHPQRCHHAVHAAAGKPWQPVMPMEIYSPWASGASKELAYGLQDDLPPPGVIEEALLSSR